MGGEGMLRVTDYGLRITGNKGQSTLEYILIIAAILVAVIAAANLLIKPAVNKAMSDAANAITDATNRLIQK